MKLIISYFLIVRRLPWNRSCWLPWTGPAERVIMINRRHFVLKPHAGAIKPEPGFSGSGFGFCQSLRCPLRWIRVTQALGTRLDQQAPFCLETLRRRNQTGTRIFWFRFWILPEPPLPAPLDKGNTGSGNEIVLKASKKVVLTRFHFQPSYHGNQRL